MGQKINPNGIRIMENCCGGWSEAKLGIFSNYWFSDFKYSSLFFNDVFIRKTNKRMFMKYYKSRVRFIKGRRRRLKSILRVNGKYFFLLRLPYKMLLLNSFYKPAQMGLQRKHAVFLYKKRKTERS